MWGGMQGLVVVGMELVVCCVSMDGVVGGKLFGRVVGVLSHIYTGAVDCSLVCLDSFSIDQYERCYF